MLRLQVLLGFYIVSLAAFGVCRSPNFLSGVNVRFLRQGMAVSKGCWVCFRVFGLILPFMILLV